MAAANNSGKPRRLDLRLNYIPVSCSDASVQVALYEEGVYPEHSTLWTSFTPVCVAVKHLGTGRNSQQEFCLRKKKLVILFLHIIPFISIYFPSES